MSSTAVVVPSLSIKGWVSSLPEKVDMLTSHAFVADNLQSTIYAGQVTSIPYIIAKYINDPVKLCLEIQTDLEDYYRRYFDQATAEVSSDVGTALGTEVALTVQITVVQNDVKYSVGTLLGISNSKLAKIVRLNNTGSSN